MYYATRLINVHRANLKINGGRQEKSRYLLCRVRTGGKEKEGRTMDQKFDREDRAISLYRVLISFIAYSTARNNRSFQSTISGWKGGEFVTNRD